jgi:uncharacterized repeat protein (TIGR02543 family)
MKSLGKKIGASILAASLTFSLLPKLAGNDIVLAAGTKDSTNTCLGTSKIKEPKVPDDKNDAWKGSYVYFGSYGGNPIKFRVLAKDSDAYGDSALFLDSDETLFNESFDNTTPFSNSWADSDIRGVLNGTFLTGFTSLEQGAIATSQGDGGLSYADPSFGKTIYVAPVSVNDKVFLLDATEVMNPAYGYSADCGRTTPSDWTLANASDWSSHEVANHKKVGSSVFWWMRSSSVDDYFAPMAGNASYNGHLNHYDVRFAIGVAPALNVDQSKILFSTLVSGNFETDDAEYKLTLIDDEIKLSETTVHELSTSTDSFKVYYDLDGKNIDKVNRVSVLILDKEYGDDDANILYYENTTGKIGSYANYKFPSSLDLAGWGTDYHVYLVAEQINSGTATDYAGVPFEISAPIYSVIVFSGYGYPIDGLMVDTAACGNTVMLIAKAPKSGKEFDKWVVNEGNVVLDDAESSITTFKMPAEEIKVTATYKDLSVWNKNQSNTDLGTTQIASPYQPQADENNKPWTGSYVYYGSYDNNQIRFRVLAPKTDVYGGSTLFLDSDEYLFGEYFDNTRPSTNVWADSYVRKELNSTFLTEFTSLEQEAIITSTGTGGVTYPAGSYVEYLCVAPVSINDKVFLLDAGEVLNPEYGYSSDCGHTTDGDWATGTISLHAVFNRTKYHDTLWLRSSTRYSLYSAGISANGFLASSGSQNGLSVAPALNVDQNSILFSSVISGTSGNYGAEYKLTIFDPELKAGVQTGKDVVADGTKITVPYAITGTDSANATQASVLILDKKYALGNANGASILYYDKLGGTFATTAEGTFTLPAALDLSGWGTDYFVYIVAEDVNGCRETDYASKPVELSAPEFTVTVTNDGNGTASASASKGTAGTEITLSKTPNTGYRFKEWQVISGGVTVADNKFTIGSSNVEVKAVFEKINYTVDVVAGKTDKTTATMGDTVKITADAPAKGKEFDKWVVATGGAVLVDPSSTTTTFTMPAGNVKVAATYKDIICKVTFETDGGSAVAQQNVAYGDMAVKPAEPTKAGYNFDGWYKDAAFTEAFDFNTAITADVTIYAKWSLIPYYTVVEGANGTCMQGTEYKMTVKRNVEDQTTINHLAGVKIDDTVLTKDKDYTAEAGSVKITIKADTMKNLGVGGHTITVLFDDGEAVTSVNVKEAASVPSTGEPIESALWAGLSLIAAAGTLLAVVYVQKKRKSIQ